MGERNRTIPATGTQVFSTAADNQTTVSIRVFQGEREMGTDNKFLGQFDLTGIPPSPRGTPQIEVTFEIDANGIMKVAAKDKATGREQNIVIQPSGGLTKDEINNMVNQSESMKEEDMKRREGVEVKKSLNEHRSKVEQGVVDEVENAIREAKEAMNSDDLDRMNQAKTNLDSASMKIGQAMYAQSNQDNQQQGEQSSEQQSEQQNEQTQEGEKSEENKDKKN